MKSKVLFCFSFHIVQTFFPSINCFQRFFSNLESWKYIGVSRASCCPSSIKKALTREQVAHVTDTFKWYNGNLWKTTFASDEVLKLHKRLLRRTLANQNHFSERTRRDRETWRRKPWIKHVLLQDSIAMCRTARNCEWRTRQSSVLTTRMILFNAVTQHLIRNYDVKNNCFYINRNQNSNNTMIPSTCSSNLADRNFFRTRSSNFENRFP